MSLIFGYTAVFMDLSFRYFLQKSYNGTQVSEILLDLFLIKNDFRAKKPNLYSFYH